MKPFASLISFSVYGLRSSKLGLSINRKTRLLPGFILGGGERGIRTLDTVIPYTDFPGLLFQPLRHLSVLGMQMYAFLRSCTNLFLLTEILADGLADVIDFF